MEMACVANVLSVESWVVTGVDSSENGIGQAHGRNPHLNTHEGSAYDDLVGRVPIGGESMLAMARRP